MSDNCIMNTIYNISLYTVTITLPTKILWFSSPDTVQRQSGETIGCSHISKIIRGISEVCL